MSEPRPTTVYILWNEDKEVIYVGITSVSMGRIGQHAADKDWWQEVRGARFQHFETRGEALEAERRAIKRWRPCYNITHVREPKPRRREREDPYVELMAKIRGGVPKARSGPYVRSGVG